MSGRSRRVVQSKSAAGVAAALERLNAAKSGAKRVDTFDLKEEAAVYDVVDEDSYAQLAQKKRIEADDFIEDDGDGDYMDTGDDHNEFFREDEEAGKGKKRKGGDKDGSAAKRQAAEEALKASKAKERLKQMFAKAAVQKPASAAKVDDKGADDLLEDILGDLDPSKTSTAGAAAAGPAAKPSSGSIFARKRAAAPAVTKTFSRGAPGSGRSGGQGPGFGAGGSGASAAAAGLGSGGSAGSGFGNRNLRPQAERKPQRQQQQQPTESVSFGGAHTHAADDDAGVDGSHAHQEEEQEFSFALPGGDADIADNPFDGSTAASDANTSPADTTPAGKAAATADTDNSTPAGAATGADSHKRFADDVPLGPDVHASPATGWMEVYGPEGEEAAEEAAAVASPAIDDAAAANAATDDAKALGADDEGNVPFFFMDAYESPDRPETLYLFGKVAASSSNSTPSKGRGSSSDGGSWQSCCVVVPNLHRSVLFVPSPDVFEDASGELAALEAAVAADPSKKIELLQALHARCGDLKSEIRALMLKHGIRSMRLVPVKRNYAFEDTAIPSREQWVIKVRYSASLPTLPLGLSGTHFVAVTGAQTSMLENLLIKRGLRGPGWTALLAPKKREGSAMVSWCKVELEVANAKGIKPAPPGSQLAARPPPQLTVAALNLRLHLDANTRQQEILAASVVHLSGVAPDAPTPKSVWGNAQALRNFSVVQKLDNRPWPTGFEQLVAQENASPRGRLNGGAMLVTAPNERALLGCLLTKLAALDADVLVGHNIGAYELVVLLTRLQTHKVQLWSRIGRLRRSTFPKLTGGGHTFGGGAGPGIMAVLAGRLLCDTYLSARELVREVDYTLKTLSKSLLSQDRAEVANAELPQRYESAAGLRELLLLGESDAWLALGLAFQLSVLPLTKQLSVVSGSLWSKTLQGARAQRIEMLLLHEFHDRKFILPDKLSLRDKTALAEKKAAAAKKGKKTAGNAATADEEYDGPALPEDDMDEEAADGAAAGPAANSTAGLSKKSGGKGPQYAGGLVLEPKKGLYDKYVIMLDFNSLYPSIIQEYNICFTTVKRPTDGSMAALPGGSDAGGAGQLAPLPTVIQGLVRRRREVKQQMKTCRDPVLLQQLQIRQQALKLTANSMYGCLGFNNSRFFARPLAELITCQGRDILQSTVDLVQDLGLSGLEVIYGDTDSIMIHTNSNDYEQAEQLGARIKAAVNRRYRLLEIELDAVYRSMLLLKKKKYAAVKVERPLSGGPLTEVLEAKGLDMVRRDWCPLSKDTGNYALSQILSGKPKPEVVEAVHERLRQVAAQLAAGQLPLGSFVITKQLTKRPEDYPDARAQPHVQVALRRRAAGKRDGVMAGETVPYIICLKLTQEQQQQQQGAGSSAEAASPAIKQEDSQQQPAGQDTPAAAAAAAATAAGGQHPQQQGGGSPAPAAAAASPAAATPGSTVGVRASTTGSTTTSSSGGIAERAYHPDELRTDPSLVIDADYYLGQQVLPVVVRLCAPIEGTNPSHLAQCLGLDPSRYGGSGNSSSNSMAAAFREEAMQVTGSLLDDDAHYARCDPLLLTSSNGTTWEFKGVRNSLRSGSPGDVLLTPPDAVGDATAELSAAQLSNQALLAARRAIVKYYDGQLVADDEMAAAADTECRDVSLAPSPAEAPAGSIPKPGAASSGVLLSRAYGADKLYTQLSHIVRLLDVRTALDRLPDKQRRDAAQQQLSMPIVAALNSAAGVVTKFRDACGYRWINLTQVFGKFGSRQQRAGAIGTGTPVQVRGG